MRNFFRFQSHEIFIIIFSSRRRRTRKEEEVDERQENFPHISSNPQFRGCIIFIINTTTALYQFRLATSSSRTWIIFRRLLPASKQWSLLLSNSESKGRGGVVAGGWRRRMNWQSRWLTETFRGFLIKSWNFRAIEFSHSLTPCRSPKKNKKILRVGVARRGYEVTRSGPI